MSKVRFTDAQWAIIQPLLPPPARTGRPRADDCKTLEGILFVLRSGCRWQDLPRRYGAPTTVWRVCIPAKRRPKAWRPKRGRPVVARREDYAQRWKVERAFAWLGNYRRILSRWERLLEVYQGLVTFVAMIICISRLAGWSTTARLEDARDS